MLNKKNIIYLISVFTLLLLQTDNSVSDEYIYDRAPDSFIEEIIQKKYDDWYGIYLLDDPEKKVGYANFKSTNTNNQYCYEWSYKTFNKITEDVDSSENSYVKQCFQSIAPFNMLFEEYIFEDYEGKYSSYSILEDGSKFSQIGSKNLKVDMYENDELIDQYYESVLDPYSLNHLFIREYLVTDENTKIGDTFIIPYYYDDGLYEHGLKVIDINERFTSGKLIKNFLFDEDTFDPEFSYQSIYDEYKLIQFRAPISFTDTIAKLEKEEDAKNINHVIDIEYESRLTINEHKFSIDDIRKLIREKLDANDSEITEIKYQIVGDYDFAFIPENFYQKVVEENGNYYLYLGPGYSFMYDSVTQEEFSEANQYMKENPKLNALAMEIIDESDTNEMKIDKLMAWVYENIEYYNEIEEYEDPYQILEMGYGDCTEISDLYIALLKSIGIPAKREIGYVGGLGSGGDMSFGWHQWAKVAVNDEWYSLDPTWDMVVDFSFNHIEAEWVESYVWKPKYQLVIDKVYFENGDILELNKL